MLYAIIFLISYWYTAIRPVNNAVKPPKIVITNNKIFENSNIYEDLINKKTPAVLFCFYI